jgi:TolA-binding protein
MHMSLAPSARALAAGLILLAVTATGCAYYNTFYLAKRYYGEGQRAQEKSASDSPTPEAATKYDSAVRQCQKMLAEYADSKWADDAAYLLGASLYGKGEYRDALKQLQAFRAKYSNSPFAPEARFMEGLAHYRLKDYPQADSILQEVEAANPKFPRRWALCYYAGESRAAEKQYAAAVAWYERAAAVGERRRDRATALRRMGDAHIQAQHADSAEIAYGRALSAEDRATQRFELALLRGDAMRQTKRYQDALDFYKYWLPFGPAEKREGDVLLRIDECLAMLNRPQEALAGYQDLIQRYPHSNVAYEAQFQVGYLYETSLNDLDAAGREYEKLKAEPPSSFGTQAARRAQNLATLREYRQKLESDTTQARARAAFMLAELSYFRLEDVDSAFGQYALVEMDFPESPYAPKAGYARLWIAAHDHGDTAEAAALTDSVVRRYRGSRYVDNALYLWKRWSGRTDARTVLLDSLLEHPDTSAVSRFREEPEPPPPADTTHIVLPQPPIQQLTSQQLQAHQDSLETELRRLLDEGKAPHRVRKYRFPKGQGPPVGTAQAADSARARSTSAPADSTRAAKTPAPADTSRTAPPAAADTSQTKRSSPPDTSTSPTVVPLR